MQSICSASFGVTEAKLPVTPLHVDSAPVPDSATTELTQHSPSAHAYMSLTGLLLTAVSTCRHCAGEGGGGPGEDDASVQHLCGGTPGQRPPMVLLDTQVTS